MKIKKLKKFVTKKNIKRAKTAFKVVSAAVAIGVAVYPLIPKYDKIKSVDTDEIIDSLTPEEMTVEEIIEEKKKISDLGPVE